MADIQVGGRFSVLPSRAHADTRLSKRDIVVLGVLAAVQDNNAVKRRAGWFQIAQGAVARLAGMPRTSVTTSVGRLASTGYLEKRSQRNGLGGTDPCEYRIVHDAELPRAYDRWRTLPRDGRVPEPPEQRRAFDNFDRGVDPLDTPQKSADFQGVEQLDRGVDPPDSGCRPARHGSDPHSPQGVEQRDTPLGDSTLESSNPLTSRIESNQPPNENSQNRIEDRSRVDPSIVGQVVQTFLKLRERYFPGARSGTSSREVLAAQAEAFLAKGVGPQLVIDVLTDRMSKTSAMGLEAPTGLTRYGNDLEKAIGRAARRVPAPAPARPETTNRARPQAAIADEEWIKWNRVRERVEAADPKGIAKAWLSEESYAGRRDGTARILVPTPMIRDQVESLRAALLEACRIELGVDDIVIAVGVRPAPARVPRTIEPSG